MTKNPFYLSRQLLVSIYFFVFTTLGATQRFAHDINWISRHLGNITPYIPLGSTQDFRIPAGYELEQMQVIFRHGSRYPEDTAIERIANAVSIVQKSTSSVDWIIGYDNVYTIERNYKLDRNGQIQLYQFGRRVASAIPQLIEKMIDDDIIRNFSAISSDIERATQSAHAFEIGLFEGYGPLAGKLIAAPLKTLPKNHSFLTTPSGSCERWYYEVYLPELAASSESSTYLEIVGRPIADRLTHELGVPNLTPVDVYDIYLACAFDVSHRGWTGTFCSLLSSQEILALEFYQDLKEYYAFSYGNPITGLSCRLVNDILDNIEHVVLGNNFNRTVVTATHEDTIAYLETFLDLFKDESPLTSDSPPSVIENRQFRSSIATSFAANFVFQVLKATENPSNYSVRMLFAEKPVIIPGCPNEICPVDTFKSIVSPKLNCDFIESECRRT